MQTTRRQLLKLAAGALAGPSALAGVGRAVGVSPSLDQVHLDPSDGGLPPTPEVDPHPFRPPAIPERAVYLNIGHGCPPLTVNDWDGTRWQQYLDRLADARFNSLHFYIWQDHLSDFAAAPTAKDSNRQLHERLRLATREAQRRAMRVVFYLTPTFGPHVAWKEHPELLADIDYVRHGFLSLCPNRDASWPLMRAFVAHELAWFADVDAVQIWFYDPGGCFCAQCRDDPVSPLVRQVEMCAPLVRAHCPRAELRVSLWPVWAWEHHFGIEYGTALVRTLAGLADATRPAAVCDTAQRDDSFLPVAREQRFATSAFFFSANVESPFVFFNPHFEFLRSTAIRVAKGGHDGAVIHSIEAGAKWLDTWIAGQYLWEPSASTQAVAQAAARFATGAPESAALLAPALIQWHDLLRHGVAGNGFREVTVAVERAVSALPPPQQAELDWLLASARAVDLIARAAEWDEPPAAIKSEFHQALTASATFHHFAPRSHAVLPHLARLVRRGWDREHF